MENQGKIFILYRLYGIMIARLNVRILCLFG